MKRMRPSRGAVLPARWTSRSPGTEARAGFTLVELLVALTLATIISMTIMVISNTAREIYQGTTKKVEVSNLFRLALLTLDRDFSQWVNTGNLEFFADGRGSGTRINRQWDEGEQVPDTRDDLGPGVVDGGEYNEYDEFASISERHYIGVDGGVDPFDPNNRKIHDAYQAYFRSLTYVDGRVREANIEYQLLDPNRPGPSGNPQPPLEVIGDRLADLVLVKIVRYHDVHPNQIMQVAENFPIIRRRIEVASNVTDFKIEYYTEDPFNTAATAGFKTPAQDYDDPIEKATAPQLLPSPSTEPPFRQFRKVFGYGSLKLQTSYARATGFKARQGDRQQQPEHQPVRFGFLSSNMLQFAELTQGDEIFVFTEANRGNLGAVAQTGTRRIDFPSGLYTVRSNESGLLQFYEIIDSSTWRGDQAPLLYKAPYIPCAVRVTLRVVDENGLNPKTLQREIWVRRKAR